MLTRQIFGQLLLCAVVSATVIHRTDRRPPQQMSRAVSGSGLSVRVYLS